MMRFPKILVAIAVVVTAVLMLVAGFIFGAAAMYYRPPHPNGVAWQGSIDAQRQAVNGGDGNIPSGEQGDQLVAEFQQQSGQYMAKSGRDELRFDVFHICIVARRNSWPSIAAAMNGDNLAQPPLDFINRLAPDPASSSWTVTIETFERVSSRYGCPEIPAGV